MAIRMNVTILYEQSKITLLQGFTDPRVPEDAMRVGTNTADTLSLVLSFRSLPKKR